MEFEDTVYLDDQNRRYVFQQTELRQIEKNPGRLTKEGVERKVGYWLKSHNRHTAAKYKAMLKMCQNFAESGTVDGFITVTDKTGQRSKKEAKFIVYSRYADGKPKEIESEIEYKERSNL